MLELLSLMTMSVLGLGNDLPSDQFMAAYQPSSNVYIENQDGEELFVLGRENRDWADFDDIPSILIHAVTSAEDKNFWLHDGVDERALARATTQNLSKISGGNRLVGGSTITQQLSKLVFVGSDRSFRRKAREILVAQRLEQVVGKARVLELYLNEIYFGRGVYGVKKAANAYFGKNLDELEVDEAAVLASLIKAPGAFSKPSNRERLLTRRNWVMKEMEENGHLIEGQRSAYTQRPIQFVETTKRISSLDTYYEDLVRRDLVNMLGSKRVKKGGLTVVVEQDMMLQHQLEYSLSKGLEAIDSIYPHRGSWVKKRSDVKQLKNWHLAQITSTSKKIMRLALSNGKNCTSSVFSAGNHPLKGSLKKNFREAEYLYVEYDGLETCYTRQVPQVSGGVAAVNARTGAIVASAGGYDYKVSKFNRAVQAYRQPGSTIKPLTYAAAFSSGWNPYEYIGDEPVSIELPGGRYWEPQNADHKFLGSISVEEALYRSRNVPTLLLAQELGFSRIWNFAKHLGLSETMPREWTITLGSAETTVVKMASAYISMLYAGDVKFATTIREVRDLDGNLIIDPSQYLCVGCQETSDFALRMKNVSEAQIQIPEQASYALRAAMRKVMTQGTGYRIGKGLPKDVIGKTGTTNHARDAWFVGQTDSLGPDPLLIVTYIGYDTPKPIARGASGARIAGPVFRDIVLGTLNGDVIKRNKPKEVDDTVISYMTTTTLNMRSAGSTSSRVIGVVPNRSMVTNVSCDGRWCKGTFNGRDGYLSQRYIRQVSGAVAGNNQNKTPDRFRSLRKFMAASGGTYKPTPKRNNLRIRDVNTQQIASTSFGNTPKVRKAPKRSVIRIIDGVEVTVNYNF